MLNQNIDTWHSLSNQTNPFPAEKLSRENLIVNINESVFLTLRAYYDQKYLYHGFFNLNIMKNKYNLKQQTINEIAAWITDHIKGNPPERRAVEEWGNIVAQHFYRMGYDEAKRKKETQSSLLK